MHPGETAARPCPDARLACVLDFENARFADPRRPPRALAQFARQARALREGHVIASDPSERAYLAGFQTVRIVATHSGDAATESVLRGLLERHVGPADGDLPWRIEPLAGADYYGLKNHGTARVRADVIVQLDCDVIPADGWLERLLLAHRDPRVDVVSGLCSVETNSLYSRAFAAGWFFHVPRPGPDLAPALGLPANNISFRAELRERFVYPTLDGTSRGACALLLHGLRREGRGIFVARKARVDHPPPRGVAHFVLRALAQGRDAVFFLDTLDRAGLDLAEFPYPPGVPPGSIAYVKRKLRRVVAFRKDVGLSRVQLPAALALMATYYALMLAGRVLARVAPRVAGRIRV